MDGAVLEITPMRHRQQANHALQRTRRERRGGHRGISGAGSLSLGR
jgi:hypothetical protein